MVSPSVWGNPAWVFLFSIVANYPNNPGIDIQHNYSRFFYHLRWVLPCESCMTNYETHFRKWPIDQYLSSRERLFQWLVIIYNEVRLSLGKKPRDETQILTYLFGEAEGQRLLDLFHQQNVYCVDQSGGGHIDSQQPNNDYNSLAVTLVVTLILFCLWVYLQNSQK